MVLHDLLHQMQAQSAATAGSAQPVERLEDRLAVIDWNTGALVADLQQAALIQAHADGAAPATVDDGVVHQVGDHPPQCQAVAVDPHRRVRRIHLEAITGPYHQRRQLGSGFAHQQRQVQPLQRTDIAVEPLQVEQMLGHVAKAGDVSEQLRLEFALGQL